MARFPDREADMMVLAQNIITGLTDNAATFPTPPVTAVALETIFSAFVALSDQVVAAQAAAEQVTITKNAGREALADAMKAVLRYAEEAVDYDDAKLSLLGWGGITNPTALQPPGQARNLEMPRQGQGWVFLDWKKPGEGGAVATYKIERRQRPAGSWALFSVTLESESMLTGQDPSIDWEYRVIAINKAGEGPPSNTTARFES